MAMMSHQEITHQFSVLFGREMNASERNIFFRLASVLRPEKNKRLTLCQSLTNGLDKEVSLPMHNPK
jgi:hypothetical protein